MNRFRSGKRQEREREGRRKGGGGGRKGGIYRDRKESVVPGPEGRRGWG